MQATSSDLRVYVACLACYNAGRLVGAWIDAAQDADDFGEEIAAVLDGSHPDLVGEHDADGLPHEEHAFHDYDGFGVSLGEYEGTETVTALARGIEEHGEAFGVWYGLGWADGLDPSEWDDAFSDAYCGEYRTAGDYCEQFVDDVYGDIPTWLAGYVDFDAMARDFECGEYAFEAGGLGVYVFRQ